MQGTRGSKRSFSPGNGRLLVALVSWNRDSEGFSYGPSHSIYGDLSNAFVAIRLFFEEMGTKPGRRIDIEPESTAKGPRLWFKAKFILRYISLEM